jgi:hypothetical protein
MFYFFETFKLFMNFMVKFCFAVAFVNPFPRFVSFVVKRFLPFPFRLALGAYSVPFLRLPSHSSRITVHASRFTHHGFNGK